MMKGSQLSLRKQRETKAKAGNKYNHINTIPSGKDLTAWQTGSFVAEEVSYADNFPLLAAAIQVSPETLQLT